MADVAPPSKSRLDDALTAALRFALVLAVFCACGLVSAQEASAPEQQIKAAYLFKFGGYVEWPQESFQDANSRIVIGVAGDPTLAEELEKVSANRNMNGRAVEVRQIRPGEEIGKVHILFVGRSQLALLGDLSSRPRPILTVTDVTKGLDQGSIINFVSAANRVRFEVSLDTAKRSSLKIGAPLLAVAMKVQ